MSRMSVTLVMNYLETIVGYDVRMITAVTFVSTSSSCTAFASITSMLRNWGYRDTVHWNIGKNSSKINGHILDGF